MEAYGNSERSWPRGLSAFLTVHEMTVVCDDGAVIPDSGVVESVVAAPSLSDYDFCVRVGGGKGVSASPPLCNPIIGRDLKTYGSRLEPILHKTIRMDRLHRHEPLLHRKQYSEHLG